MGIWRDARYAYHRHPRQELAEESGVSILILIHRDGPGDRLPIPGSTEARAVMNRPTLFGRLVVTYLAVSLLGLLILGLLLDALLERRAVSSLEDRLLAEARSVKESVRETEGSALQTRIRELGNASGTRLTVIRSDGVVLADSVHDPQKMVNHASRPEVRSSLQGAIGRDERVSGTTGLPYLYVTLPVDEGRIYRAALSLDIVEEQRQSVRGVIVITSLAVALALAVVSFVTARKIAAPIERMAEDARRVQRGEQKLVSTSGTSETNLLGQAINEMAEELARRIGELADERELREEVLASMSIGVVMSAPDGQLLYTNKAAEALVGTGRLSDLERRLGEEGGKLELTVRHAGRRVLRAVANPLTGGRVLTLIEDITIEKRLDEIRRDFVANASHELKTPVAAILATAETLSSATQDDPSSAKRFSLTLVQDARRLARLVEDLLDLARLEASPEEWRDVDFADVVQREVSLHSDEAESKGLKLSTRLEAATTVYADEAALALLVRNLVENAVRYTNEGRVEVRLSKSNGEARFEVEDTGVGIPEEARARVFERFYRVDKARSRETGGTGLGLSIVRHIAESHGGRVRLTSEVGRGSMFTVVIPATNDARAHDTK